MVPARSLTIARRGPDSATADRVSASKVDSSILSVSCPARFLRRLSAAPRYLALASAHSPRRAGTHWAHIADRGEVQALRHQAQLFASLVVMRHGGATGRAWGKGGADPSLIPLTEPEVRR